MIIDYIRKFTSLNITVAVKLIASTWKSLTKILHTATFQVSLLIYTRINYVTKQIICKTNIDFPLLYYKNIRVSDKPKPKITRQDYVSEKICFLFAKEPIVWTRAS